MKIQAGIILQLSWLLPLHGPVVLIYSQDELLPLFAACQTTYTHADIQVCG